MDNFSEIGIVKGYKTLTSDGETYAERLLAIEKTDEGNVYCRKYIVNPDDSTITLDGEVDIGTDDVTSVDIDHDYVVLAMANFNDG